MLDAKLVQHRGVEVMDRADVFNRRIAQLIARTIHKPALDPAASQPDAHRLVVMVAAVALRHRRPPELAGPDHDRAVEHAAVLQIGDQGHAGPVDLLRLELDAVFHAAMVVPVLVVELDEPHAPLGQPPREQAVRGERAIAWLAAVEFERLGTLVLRIHQFGHARLHRKGHFILRDPRGDLGIARERIVLGVDGVDRGDVGPLPLPCDPGGAAQVEHRVSLAPQLHALIPAGQETARPLPGRNRLVLATLAKRRQHHEPRQVGRVTPQAIGDPRPHAGSARDLRSGVHEHVGRIVIDGVGRHRADQADVAEHRADVGEERADFGAVGAHLRKGMLRAKAGQLLPLQLRELLSLRHALGHRLPVELCQLRLVVEGFEVRRPTGHRQPDHPLCPLRQRRLFKHASERRGLEQPWSRERRQSHATHTLGGASEKSPSGECIVLVNSRAMHAHGLVIVSWRFRRTRATWVQAASSTLSMSGGTAVRPVVSSDSAAAGLAL